MLFWIFVILLIVGIILYRLDFEFAGECVEVTSGLAIAISLFVIILELGSASSYIEKYQEQYKALTYKIESNSYRDEFGLLNKEVIDEVQEYNEKVRFTQEIQDNFWVGIYFRNVYDSLKTIDYENFKTE